MVSLEKGSGRNVCLARAGYFAVQSRKRNGTTSHSTFPDKEAAIEERQQLLARQRTRRRLAEAAVRYVRRITGREKLTPGQKMSA